jgi:hypothetical protein
VWICSSKGGMRKLQEGNDGIPHSPLHYILYQPAKKYLPSPGVLPVPSPTVPRPPSGLHPQPWEFFWQNALSPALPPQSRWSASLITSSHKSGSGVARPLNTVRMHLLSQMFLAQRVTGSTLTCRGKKVLERQQAPASRLKLIKAGPTCPSTRPRPHRLRPSPGPAHGAQQLAWQLARKKGRGNTEGVSVWALCACARRSRPGEGLYPGSERRKCKGQGSCLLVPPHLDCAMQAKGELGSRGSCRPDPGLVDLSVYVSRETWNTVWRPRRWTEWTGARSSALLGWGGKYWSAPRGGQWTGILQSDPEATWGSFTARAPTRKDGRSLVPSAS